MGHYIEVPGLYLTLRRKVRTHELMFTAYVWVGENLLIYGCFYRCWEVEDIPDVGLLRSKGIVLDLEEEGENT